MRLLSLPCLGDGFVRTTRTDVSFRFVLLLLNSFDTVFTFVDCRTLWGNKCAITGLIYVQVPYLLGRFLDEY